jgi:hypothetical protein
MSLNKILLLFTGSAYVENAPLEVCAKLVIDSKRERRQQEELYTPITYMSTTGNSSAHGANLFVGFSVQLIFF